MAVYKDGDKWRVIYRYTNYKGERKQTQKRGFATKREIWYYGRILLLESGGFLCVGFPLIPSTERAGLLPTLRQNLPLYYLLRTIGKIRQCLAEFPFVFS